MKYFNAIPEEQETIINFIYENEIVRIYSNEIETIKKLTKHLGKPDKQYRKNKTYWSGASWDISFHDLSKLKKVLNRETFIAKDFKPSTKKKVKENDKKVSYQIMLDL